MSDKPYAVVPPPVSNAFGNTERLGWCAHQSFLVASLAVMLLKLSRPEDANTTVVTGWSMA